MRRSSHPAFFILAAVLAFVGSSGGCTSVHDYVHNGFKVGPNYCQPAAPVAEHWIDETDLRRDDNPDIQKHWWTVFKDPKLNYLVDCAYRENLTLKEACFRVLQARALRQVAVGEIFPQQQNAFGDYRRINNNATSTYVDQWDDGFTLSWELDFWGRFRRAIAAADDNLNAAVADYDDVLVTLQGDVAVNYVQIRTDQERIALLKANATLQREVLEFIEKRYKAGFRQTELDLDQATSTLKQTEAAIPQLEIDQRQAENQLCVLLGMPPKAIGEMLGPGPIPTAPPEVAVGIPADLLRRRPDIRRAESLAAAQAELIGIAQADLYPAFSLNGTLGYQAQNFSDLFKSNAFTGSVGPSFRWNVLNYGRIVNNVRFNDARFQELAYAYQDTVLRADREVENGLVSFLKSQRRERLLGESVEAANKAFKIVVAQYEKGAVDFNRYALIEQNLVTQQDSLAQARGQISQGLISVYRALGGGWQMRLSEEESGVVPAANAFPELPKPLEAVPAPIPEAPKVRDEIPSPPSDAPEPPDIAEPAEPDSKP